jgi:hypothetical protein
MKLNFWLVLSIISFVSLFVAWLLSKHILSLAAAKRWIWTFAIVEVFAIASFICGTKTPHAPGPIFYVNPGDTATVLIEPGDWQPIRIVGSAYVSFSPKIAPLVGDHLQVNYLREDVVLGSATSSAENLYPRITISRSGDYEFIHLSSNAREIMVIGF